MAPCKRTQKLLKSVISKKGDEHMYVRKTKRSKCMFTNEFAFLLMLAEANCIQILTRFFKNVNFKKS